jgi:hypothetical protein
VWFNWAVHKTLQTIVAACDSLSRHHAVPGYNQLPWRTRCRLNVQSLGCFLSSQECLHMLAYLLIWLLAGFNLVWRWDVRDSAAVLPVLLACMWVWPWAAAARRRWIHHLLGGRWPL